jgi:hypothetical protein
MRPVNTTGATRIILLVRSTLLVRSALMVGNIWNLPIVIPRVAADVIV